MDIVALIKRSIQNWQAFIFQNLSSAKSLIKPYKNSFIGGRDDKRSNKSTDAKGIFWALHALISLKFFSFAIPDVKKSFFFKACILVSNKLDSLGIKSLRLE